MAAYVSSITIAAIFVFIAGVHTHTDNKRILLENEPTVDLGGELGKLQAQINGFTAGKYHTEGGSGTDNLCLPVDPTWSKYVDGRSGYKGYIYGTEIDTVDSEHIFNNPVNNQDIPCAVCRSTNPSTVMIPARNNCYAGWTIEYNGYLMAGYHDYHGYNHICVDENPEFLQHGSTNDDQHVLYLVEGRCGSLPCPPYVDGRELACVVCSK